MSRTTILEDKADLGSHNQVYQRAVESLSQFDEVLARLANIKEKLRAAETKLSDHEMSVAIQYRADNLEMSQTQFDRQVRWAIAQDSHYLTLRKEVAILKAQTDALEADSSVLKREIEISTTRMRCLAGYFALRAIERLVACDS